VSPGDPRHGAAVRRNATRRADSPVAARRTKVFEYPAMADFSTQRGLIFNGSTHSIFQKDKCRIFENMERRRAGSPLRAGFAVTIQRLAKWRWMSVEIGPHATAARHDVE
jgi:hypothetical protein